MFKSLNFVKNIGVSYIAVVLKSFIGLYSVSLSISYFSAEEYGIWLLVSSIIAYLSISSFGIPTASAAMIAKSSSHYYQKQVVIKSFLSLCSISSFFLFVLFIFNTIYPDWLQLLGTFRGDNETLAKNVFIMMIMGFLFRAPLQIALTAFTALQKTYVSKLYDLAIFLSNFFVLLIVIINDYNLSMLAILTVFANVFINIAAFLHFLYSHRVKEEKGKNVKIIKILSNGLPFFYMGITSTIVWSTDNIVISHLIGVEKIVVYSVAFKLFTTGFIVFTALSAVMFPAYGKYFSQNQWSNIQKLYDFNLKFLPFIASVIWLGGILFGKEIVLLWTGKEKMFGGYLLFFALGGYGFVLSVVNTHSNLLSGLNIVKNIVKIGWFEAILNVIISMLLASKFGVAGVAIGTFCASLLGPFLFFPKYIKLNTNNKINSILTEHIKVLLIVVVIIISLSLLSIFNNPNIFIKIAILLGYIFTYLFVLRRKIFSMYKLIRFS